jgi:hypothetical protein
MEQIQRGGLPEPLPRDERVLWEGAPRWTSLALHAFHARKAALYFAVLLAWRILANVTDGVSVGQAVTGSVGLALLAVLAVGLLCLMGWLTSRTALYTVTSERVVMRIGIVLTVTFNLPFRTVGSAGLKIRADGSGDIPLGLSGTDRIAYLHLWPHARPWHLKQPQPMLRGIPDAVRVAGILSRALAASAGGGARPVTAAGDTASNVAGRSGPLAAA